MFRKDIPRLVYVFVMLALLVRIGFLLKGAEIYYGEGKSRFLNGDSWSYIKSFTNLINHGVYTSTMGNPEAAFGRLPGYPLFYGFHYLLVGEADVNHAVAISQILLDCIGVYLLFSIITAVSGNKRIGIVGAGIYAFYPFTIVWTTIIGTESFACFLTLLFFYLLTKHKPFYKYDLVLGLTIALSFYTREYLGIFLVVCYVCFFFKYKWKLFFEHSFLVTTVFFLLYLPWPIRNYLLTNKIIPVKTITAGYERYAEDVASSRSWIYAWSQDADYYLNKIAQTRDKNFVPQEVFPTEEDKILFYRVLELSRKCGSGFYVWKTNQSFTGENCNAEISLGYSQLLDTYKKVWPIKYYFQIPALNLQKALFKNEFTKKNHSRGNASLKELISPLLFFYRSLLLILGLVGCFLFIRKNEIKSILFFFGFIYLLICFLIRQVEMRYLLQADVLFLIPAVLSVEAFFQKISKTKIVS